MSEAGAKPPVAVDREQWAPDDHFRLEVGAEPGLFVRRRSAPADGRRARARSVVYVHGSTFPSGLSIAWRLDGRSWMDELSARGFDVWSFDFAGFGHSARYAEMEASPRPGAEPLGRAPAAAEQLERVVEFAVARLGAARVSIVAHSWGTIPSAIVAARRPELIDRLVFFGPIAPRAQEDLPEPHSLGNWYPLTAEAQFDRFVRDVPAGYAPVLAKRHFEEWAAAYLDSDPTGRASTPPMVRTPSGPLADILAAWRGELAYDPGELRTPVAIIRGEWDSLCADRDAGWLFDRLESCTLRRDIKIDRATHVMHLERSRFALYRETEAFLAADDIAPPVCADEREAG